MGTETTLHLTVHQCRPDQVRAVLAAIDEFAMVQNADVERGRITLGAPYEAHETDPEDLDNLAAQLLDRAPDATWTVYATPTSEVPGQLIRRSPIVGTWRARCDFEGQPDIARDEVVAARAAGDRVLDVVLGLAWEDLVGALHVAHRGEVVAGWPAGHRAVWREETVTIHGAADDGGDLTVPVAMPEGSDFHDAGRIVADHVEHPLLLAGFAVVRGTWVHAESSWVGELAMEGEVFAQVTAGVDKRLRLRPTDDQLAAAGAALAAAPAATDAVVALALPGNRKGFWTIGQDVEAVEGLWLVTDGPDEGADNDDQVVTYRHAADRADAAAVAHLVDSDRVGTPCHVQIHRDGTWTVFEGCAIPAAAADTPPVV